MKAKTVIIFLVILFQNCSILSGQIYFERLLPWTGDTSNVATEVIHTPNGGYLILSRLFEFANVQGTPVHGWKFLGNAVAWTDSVGLQNQTRRYNTNFNPQFGCNNGASTLACNPSPTNNIEISSSGNITLPVATFGGWELCAEGIAANREIFIHTIDAVDGEFIASNQFIPDSMCIRYFGLADYKSNEDGTAIILIKDFNFDNIGAYRINQDLSYSYLGVIPDTVFIPFTNPFYAKIDSDSNFIWYSNPKLGVLQQYNFFGELQSSFPIGITSVVTPHFRKIEFYGEYIIYLQSGFSVVSPSTTIQKNSVLNVFTRGGSLYTRKIFEGKIFNDFDITAEGNLIVLETLLGFDTLEKPQQVHSFSLPSIGVLGSSPRLGFNFVSGEKIHALDDESYLILGTKKTSTIDDSTKQKDEVYFAKQPISEIVLSDLEVNKAKYEIQIFPNPSANIFTIQCRDCTLQSAELFDALGRHILYETIANSHHHIDLGLLASGVYYLKMYDKEHEYVSTKKLVKY